MTQAARDGHGRPLRFLGAVATGWIELRTAMLWPVPALPTAAISAPPVQIVTAMTARIARLDRGTDRRAGRVAPMSRPGRPPRHPADVPPNATIVPRTAIVMPDQPIDFPVAPGFARSVAMRPAPSFDVPAFALPGRPAERRDRPDRWSASAWAVGRFGAGQAQRPVGGQLGGSQAGLRVVRTLDRRGRVALAGRVTSPLGSGLREASLGLEWQPTRLPVKLVAEHRFALGAGPGAPGVALVGGFGPSAIGHGLRVETYGQAGVIRRVRTEPYADAAVRITRHAGALGAVRFDLGAGAWGGGQRGAARLDLGPSGSITVPLRRASLRLTLDWRERVAGAARPGSGPAVTLGTDF